MFGTIQHKRLRRERLVIKPIHLTFGGHKVCHRGFDGLYIVPELRPLFLRGFDIADRPQYVFFVNLSEGFQDGFSRLSCNLAQLLSNFGFPGNQAVGFVGQLQGASSTGTVTVSRMLTSDRGRDSTLCMLSSTFWAPRSRTRRGIGVA